MAYKIKAWWDYIQSLFDIDGDVVLLGFTIAIVYVIVKGTLSPAGAAAYASAVGAFAYSNHGGKS